MTYPLNRRRQRRAAAVAFPLVAGMLLAACGSGDSGGGDGGAEPQTITFSYASANTAEDAYEQLAKDYMAAHKGVTIKTNRVALDSYNQTITTQMQAGNGPDVLYINGGTGQAGSVGQLGKAGLLLELPDSLNDVLPEGDDALYQVNDKLYGIPVAVAFAAMVYNDQLAQSAGVTLTADSTLEDLTGQCGAVHDAGKSVLGLAGSVPQNTGIMAMELASSIVYGPNPDWNEQRADGKVTFADSDEWKDTLQATVDLYKADCFQDGAAGAGFDALTNGAGQGNLYGFFAPSGATKDIMDAAPPGAVNLVALPLPAPQGTDNYLALTSNIGLAGNAKTESPELVKDFISFLATPEEAKKFADSQGSIPIGAEIDTSALLPQYAPVAQLLEDKQYRPFGIDTWPNGQVYDALGSGVTGLFTGQKTIDDVLEAMDAAWGS
jgi:raffinose/stachyose/melibiose transport system substrate-binding protein